MRKDYLTDNNSKHSDESTFVEEYWTRVWERHGGPQLNLINLSRKDEYRVIAPYLSTLSNGAKIMDGGCGRGEWVMALSKQGYNMVGMDISRKTIQQLQDLFPEAGFVQGDIRDTNIADNYFDAYYSWGVFEHFEAGPGDVFERRCEFLSLGAYFSFLYPLITCDKV